MRIFESVTLLENAGALDRAVGPLRAAVRKALGAGPARDALHGVWLGHPLHPSLVQVSLGAFVSAGMLDAMPGQEVAVRTLISTGLVTAVPSAGSGWADWSEMHEQQQRVGLVHAGANLVALGMYAASLVQRRRGRAVRGKALAYAGLGVLGVSGFIGGHMSFRQAAGANHAEAVPHLVRAGWHDLCALDDLGSDGVPQRRVLTEDGEAVPLLVVRHGERIDVLSDRCSHLSGPLHQGEVTGGGTCITCPWHGSTFSLVDGSVRSGPATAPVHAFDVRVDSGRVMVRLPGAA